MGQPTKITRRFLRYPDLTDKRQAEGGLRLTGQPVTGTPDGPLVSVVTVCFNAAATIEQALRSVQAQTYGAIEHIVVDGASTDGTVDILHRHKDRLAYYVSEPDDGLYYAMNKGLELAQGDYVLFLNADDWYETRAVEHLVAAVVESGRDFSGALARYIHADGRSHVLRSMPFDRSVLLRMPLRHETMLVPADLYDRVGAYDPTYSIIADYDFTIRLFQAGATYFELREPLLNFRTDGVSNTATDRLNTETRTLLGKLFPFLAEPELFALTDHANITPDIFIRLANSYSDQSHFVAAVRGLLADRKRASGPQWQAADLSAVVVDPQISVVVPVYNAASTLANALGTALSQDFEALEVICVDDGSTDNSVRVVTDLAACDPRVRLLSNPRNLGPGGSRNAGLRAARGRYVFFLDADDAIAPGALGTLYRHAHATNSAITRGAFLANQQVHGQSGGGVVKFPAGHRDGVITTTLQKTPALLASTEGHWSALYETEFALSILYPEDLQVGEDSLFTVEALALAPSVTLVPEVVYHYRDNPDSTMNRMSAQKYFDGLLWRRRAYRILGNVGAAELGIRLLFNFWSTAYFDGLERTMSTQELAAYRCNLIAAFAEAGRTVTTETLDHNLRDRLSRLLGACADPASVPRSPKLRIATFSTQDHGGAGIGSLRRVEALRREGHDAEIYCLFRKTGLPYVNSLPASRPDGGPIPEDKTHEAWREAAVLSRSEEPALSASELFSKTGAVVDFRAARPVFEAADIVHLHWVSGVLDYENADQLADRPVVWTLADMNAFTGGCHYSEGCEGYRHECRDCPLLGGGSDLAHRNWQTKRDAYAKIPDLHVICPSQWLADRARDSALLGDRPVHMIPNALPVRRFTPTNRLAARRRLGLPLNARLVAFGADNLANRRKGGDILRDAVGRLKKMGKADGVEGLFFGANTLDLGIPAHSMGHISDEERMSLIYAAADVFAFPSREDNAPLTVAEALLSGTPVVGFPVGNVPELVSHLDTGYIAAYEDAADFARGLAWALEAPNLPATLERRLRGHLKARRHNDPDTAVARHIALYQTLLENRAAGS